MVNLFYFEAPGGYLGGNQDHSRRVRPQHTEAQDRGAETVTERRVDGERGTQKEGY